MGKFSVSAVAIACAALAWTAASGPVLAQSADGGGSKADLRTRQLALFDQLKSAPDNLQLMLDYAAVSAQLEDYEAAISTLERLLIFDPTITRAQVELGVAYYRLGSYAVAEYYFKQAQGQADLSPDLRARIDEFLTAIAARTAPNSFQGYATAGIVYATNANLGPNNENIEFLGNTAVLPASATKQDDVGVRVVLSGTHLYDLGRPNGDVWRTDASLFAVRFLEQEDGNYESALVRSGPVLKITDEAFGPTIRPFAEIELARSDDQTLYRTIGAGAEFAYPVDDQYSIFSSLKVIERQFYANNGNFDGFTTIGQAGVAFAPSADLVLRGGYFFELGRTAADFNDSGEFGLRTSASYKYDSGLSFVERDWRLDGFAEISRRLFDQPDPTINPDRTRQETEFRVGVNHTFYLFDSLFGQLTVDYVNRQSNISNFDLDGVTVAASIGRNF